MAQLRWQFYYMAFNITSWLAYHIQAVGVYLHWLACDFKQPSPKRGQNITKNSGLFVTL